MGLKAKWEADKQPGEVIQATTMLKKTDGTQVQLTEAIFYIDGPRFTHFLGFDDQPIGVNVDPTMPYTRDDLLKAIPLGYLVNPTATVNQYQHITVEGPAPDEDHHVE